MKVSDLQKRSQLTSMRGTIADIDAKTSGYQTKINALRHSGYMFEKNLETNATDLHTRWKDTSAQIRQKVNQELALLQREMARVDSEIRQLSSVKGNFSLANSRLPTVSSSVSNFEAKVQASERALEGMFSGLKAEIDSFSRRLDEIATMLQNFQSASFTLLSSEAGIASVKAKWLKTGQEQKDDPEGLLFLTDQRLLFEQREEVATKKVLFISTEKKLVQQLCFETPLAGISAMKTRQTGVFKNEDVIDMELTNAFASNVSLHIWQDNEKWKSMINQAVQGDFDADRVKPVDEKVIDALKNLPSQCPKCGAVWNKPVTRGLKSYSCDYCGYVHRI